MYNKETCICITCDNCGELYRDEHSGFSLFVDEWSAHEAVDNDSWYSESGTHYCPACHKIDDEDNLVVNFSRHQVLPPPPPSTDATEDAWELARQDAESKMPEDWDRKDNIAIGIFYSHLMRFIQNNYTITRK